MREPRRARLALVAALAVVAALLAGCGGLPEHGPVQTGRRLDAPAEPIRVLPAGPEAGADPEAIVHGFLRAAAGFEEDHAVARSFLATGTGASWRPERGVVVYGDDGSLVLRQDGAGTVVASVPVVATISPEGRYRDVPPGTTATASFDVGLVSGQWRITQVDGGYGLWLPRYDVDRIYGAVRLYFAAADRNVLVPDVRWYPVRQGLATTLARGVLAGPPSYLTGAVATGFPPGTTLGVDAVPTRGTRAAVDLSREALGATPAQRRLMWAQMTATLRQVPGPLSGVDLSVGGVPFDVPGTVDQDPRSADGTGLPADPTVDGPVVVASGAALRRLLPDSQSEPPSVANVPAGLTDLAAAVDGASYAGLTGRGTALVVVHPGGTSEVVARGPGLRSPTYDPEGWLWWGDGRGGLQALGAGGTRTVDQGWLAGRTIRWVQVSRDGSRLAVVSVGREGAALRTRLDVTGIQRDGTGAPVRLTQRLECAPLLEDFGSVAWIGPTDLVVLARGVGDRTPQPYQVGVGGTSTPLPPVSGAVDVAGGDGPRSVYLVTGGGDVLARTGAGWRGVARGTGVAVAP